MWFFIIFLLFLTFIGIIINHYLNSCPHLWKVIEEGDITNSRGRIGRYQIRRCEHCMKIKYDRIDFPE